MLCPVPVAIDIGGQVTPAAVNCAVGGGQVKVVKIDEVPTNNVLA